MEEVREGAALKPLWNFDPTDGRDELNFSEFPLAMIANRLPDGQKTLSFEDEIWDEGTKQKISRKLTISGSDQYGLPTPRDNDVLLALIHLTKCRNDFSEPTVFFSRYELVKFLQWDDSGKSYKRLEQSLNVLASVTLQYNRAWWDRKGNAWRNKTFHILETVDLRGRDFAGSSEQPMSSLTWNGTVFSSFSAHYIKKINLEVYFKLGSPAAKQAYRFLDKRFYHKRRLEFDLQTFGCEHVGFSRMYDNAQLKRKLGTAIRELEEVGFLKPMSQDERFRKEGKGNWKIILERAQKAIPETNVPELSKGAEALVARGVSAGTALELAAQFSETEIVRQVEAFDEILAKRPSAFSNPAGYLVKAIRESYQVRGQAVKSEPVTKAVSRPAPLVEPVEDRPDPRQLRREAFLSQMTDNEREKFEAEAFREADTLSVTGYNRAIESGSDELVRTYRQIILNQKVDRELSERELKLAS